MPVTQLQIDNLKRIRDAAQTSVSNAKIRMDSWCQAVSSRKYTEGTNKLTCSQKVAVICGDQIDAICCKSTNYSDDTCERDKSTYNSTVTDWEQAQDNLDRAQNDLDTALEEFSEQQGGKIDKEVSKLESEAKEIRTRYYVFGAIAIVLLAAGIFVYMKYFSKK